MWCGVLIAWGSQERYLEPPSHHRALEHCSASHEDAGCGVVGAPQDEARAKRVTSLGSERMSGACAVESGQLPRVQGGSHRLINGEARRVVSGGATRAIHEWARWDRRAERTAVRLRCGHEVAARGRGVERTLRTRLLSPAFPSTHDMTKAMTNEHDE